MCRFLSTNRRRINTVALSHCDGSEFIIYGGEQREMSPEVEEDGVEAAVCEQRRCAVGEQEQLSDEGLRARAET